MIDGNGLANFAAGEIGKVVLVVAVVAIVIGVVVGVLVF